MPLSPRRILPALAAAMLALPAPAGEAAPHGAIATLDLAAQLHAHALDRGDALLAVAALRLAGSVALRDGAGWDRTSAEAAPPAGPVAGGGYSALGLLSGEMEAVTRELAAGNDDLLALVDAATAQSARGRVGAADGQAASIGPGGQDIWRIAFAGMEPAGVGIFGDAAAALTLRVTDAEGQPVCPAAPAHGWTSCTFTPPENAFYTVTVTSHSAAEARYLLATD